MSVEEHDTTVNGSHGYDRGDPVAVRFNADLQTQFKGFVIRSGPDRLRIKVHEAKGDLASEGTCLNWDVSIPWTSIAFVLRMNTKPVDCACREDLP